MDAGACCHDVGEVVRLVEGDAVLRGDQRVGVDVEAGDDAEVGAATFEGAEEIGVFVGVCVGDAAAGEDDLGKSR